MVDGHDTPEEAARAGTPERFTRVVWVERSGDRAIVLLQLDSEESGYFDVSRCVRGPRGWHYEVSGDADGSEQPADYEHWLETGEA
jgi:hypothetical protein